jgi:glycosyltransferase 2 family protein
LAISYGVGVGCLYWVFHGIPFRALLKSMARIQWWYIPPAALLELLVYFCAGWEWQLLLQPAGRLSVWRSTQTLFAGRFANDVLPVHAGYVLRVYLSATWTGSSVAGVLPSLLMERLFDSLWLALSIGATVLLFPLPADLAHSGEALGGAIVLGTAAVLWLSLRRPPPKPEGHAHRRWRWKPLRKLRRFWLKLERGVRGIARSYLLPSALGLSGLKLVLTGLGFFLLLWSYRLHFSFVVSLTIFLLAYVGISMPSTPASVGVFQLFCVEGLRFFGVSKTVALGFALVAFVVWTAPLSIGGFIALAQSGLTWRQLRRQIQDWRES